MKLRKAKRRLEARIRDWESIRGDLSTPKIKLVNKSAFTKPGSNSK